MERERKGSSRQYYAADFKEEIIRMLNSGKNVSEISRTFGIGQNVLYTWNRTAEADESKNKS
ncbi:transposase [Emticicia sp. 21SJ11W-3]|uniref:transposase n=1 Tax=Emticicia sp. 21SJ11W-3 TaxID=2916755 RepID=UPI0038D3647C